MEMKRFILKLLLTSILAGLFICVIVSVSYPLFNKQNKNQLASYDIKINRLEQTKGQQRIIILSGSNGVFSYNSIMMKKVMNKEVINCSMHAGVGIANEANLFFDFIDKEKDLVLISPEFETMWEFNPKFQSEEAVYTKSLRPLSFPDATVWLYFLQRNNPVTYLKEILVSRERTVYHKDNFNEFGDLSHYPTQRTYVMGEVERGKKIVFNLRVKEAIKYLKQKFEGYNYYVTLPIIHPSWDRVSIAKYNSMMRDSFGSHYVDVSSMQSVISEEMFYNTIYHANAIGKDVYTAQVAEALHEATSSK
jgi:hypothetical protein